MEIRLNSGNTLHLTASAGRIDIGEVDRHGYLVHEDYILDDEVMTLLTDSGLLDRIRQAL